MIPLLIVDDESIIRETIAAMLRRKNPQTSSIFSLPPTARRPFLLVASENVELVLADIKMPVMNGLELLHRLHEQQLQCDVIFISGFNRVCLLSGKPR